MMSKPTLNQRSSGVLLHLTSLPTPGPIGRMGLEAVKFIDFLAKSGQKWWQTLPINPIGSGNSPYSTISSFAGEAMLIDPAIWQDYGFIRGETGGKAGSAKANFGAARKQFESTARQAFEQFKQKPNLKFKQGLANFSQEQKHWLADYSLYCSIAEDHGSDWSQWPDALRERRPEALKAALMHWQSSVEFHHFLQFSFDLSWKKLRAAADNKGIRLIGDIPIFVAHNSADVWANQKYFWLNKDGSPKFVAGVPPDYFNKDGQLWGNALYKWPALQRDGFKFWVHRLRRLLQLYDVIRIDHFIGFYRYWEIPAAAKTARSGKWVHAPGEALFETLTKAMGPDHLIAEDLGLLVPGVILLRDQFLIPGMRVLQFGFGNGGDGAYHMPYQYPIRSVAYTGTHDNDTLTGWYETAKRQAKRPKPPFDFARIQGALGTESRTAHWQAINTVAMSPANTCIMQMQDILGLGSRSRMNVPGTPTGNWTWRMSRWPNAAEQQKLLSIMRGSNRL